jgi:hypothetical protein
MLDFKVGTGYEQADPGLYIYDAATGRVVASQDTIPDASDLMVIMEDRELHDAWVVISATTQRDAGNAT